MQVASVCGLAKAENGENGVSVNFALTMPGTLESDLAKLHSGPIFSRIP